jgi:predicted RNA-binding Zn-ribbon protein involved in translation (DUF1610 family)
MTYYTVELYKYTKQNYSKDEWEGLKDWGSELTAPACEISNIIYCNSCRKCGTQYVGETGRKARNRLNIFTA